MSEIPQSDTIADLIDAHYASKKENPRPHLGCSMIGNPCDRWLWLSFRWAVIEQFKGRILRLFKRGHMEEPTVVENLRAIGMTITHTGQDQARVSFGASVSGSIDGIIESGVIGAPKTPHILEIKTHSKKSFDDLEKHGVEQSKPVHYAQIQVYMLGKKLDRALYVSVCKDDDRLYTERVRLDKPAAEKLVDRGRRIALSDRLPEPLSADPSWYQCKFCPGHEFCFNGHLTKQVNCRTCAHSTSTEENQFICSRWDNAPIPYEHQLTGCPSHVLHPDLVPWQMGDSASDWEAVYIIRGKPVRNGEGCANTYTSRELIDHHGVAGDKFVDDVKAFGGHIC